MSVVRGWISFMIGSTWAVFVGSVAESDELLEPIKIGLVIASLVFAMAVVAVVARIDAEGLE